jgi:hypothetical protein
MSYSTRIIFITLVLLTAVSTAYAAPTVVYGFDGTGKNEKYGDKTNVYHFLKAHRASGSSVQGVYAPGVGSSIPPGMFGFLNLPGVATGLGGREIIESMYEQLVKNFKKGHTGIVLVGFSRGAALAREFANVVNERGNPLKYKKGKRPYGKPPTIKFMALFDTVYSFGSAAGSVDLGYRKYIPLNVKAVAHATAKLEGRKTFDLWSIHLNKKVANKRKTEDDGGKTGSIKSGNYRIEKEFNGGHDDIGGAEKNNYNGYDPLVWVLREGRKAGVRLAIPSRSTYQTGRKVAPNDSHAGKRQVYLPKKPKKVPAIYYKKAKKGCEGKQVYRSGTMCYACPKGYKRKSLTRKMTHPEACEERGLGFG